MDYFEREEMKAEAWHCLGSELLSINEKAYALFRIIEAHYWRAREQLDDMPASFRRRVHGKRYSKFYELEIDIYTRNWLAANQNIPVGQDVFEYVINELGYKPVPSKYLPVGSTSYREPA